MGGEPARSFAMRSDSELLISIFQSEKKMGLLMQSDFAKYDGIKSNLRIRWRKSSDFGISRQTLAQTPTTGPIGLSKRRRA